MASDPVRDLLTGLIAKHETDMATVSRAIGRNHAYLQQFLKAGKPRQLPEEVREKLAGHFKIDPDCFRLQAPNASSHLAGHERELIASFRALPPDKQEMVLVICKCLALDHAAVDAAAGTRTGT